MKLSGDSVSSKDEIKLPLVSVGCVLVKLCALLPSEGAYGMSDPMAGRVICQRRFLVIPCESVWNEVIF